ncbi:hypothetical protein H5P28_02795 [Ruficoccus amylovorans]|uniref:Uncharacterized protein n=1 Tax=Ruficoccus amylovorans TaxID=1804625 RepID=A0A842HA53_9BACT|nr:hypothetical protein [Ruficoccus amylovorans]MBC2593180.1 hypothetical protein [Ruficoccus amylovorans]
MSNLKRSLLLLITAGLLAGTAHARIGESRSSLENRLFKDRKGVKVPARDQSNWITHKSVPYRALYEFFPDGIEEAVYYKIAEDGQATTADVNENQFPDGWMLHVVYKNGQSVFEAYRRNGAGITRYEEEAILVVNQGGSHWQRVNAKEAKPSVFGYNLERADGQVRAQLRGNYLLVYRVEFDEVVKAGKDEADAETDAEKKDEAPKSVEGF